MRILGRLIDREWGDDLGGSCDWCKSGVAKIRVEHPHSGGMERLRDLRVCEECYKYSYYINRPYQQPFSVEGGRFKDSLGQNVNQEDIIEILDFYFT